MENQYSWLCALDAGDAAADIFPFVAWSATFSFDGLWMAQAQAVYVNPGITLSVSLLSCVRINFTSSQPRETERKTIVSHAGAVMA